MTCPLCESLETQKSYVVKQRDYFTCSECHLVFADPQKLLDAFDEKERYSHHQNDIKDEGYLQFLDRLLIPLQTYIEKTQHGLDYGSGPYPMLTEVLTKRGYQLDAYDPFFASEGIQAENYDYLVVCEVAEHFYYPKVEFQKLCKLLRPQGKLALMTSIRYPAIDFLKWYYIQDDTHVAFYAPETVMWISRYFDLKILYFEKNVVIFEKN